MRTDLIHALIAKGKTLATAESCTGGGIGHALTAVPGSSAAYKGGVISYTNAVKESVLGVSRTVLETKGAVSEETARLMAEGVRKVIGSDLGISVTGLAGPDVDGSGKPVGLVYIGAADGNQTIVQEFVFTGNREVIRNKAIAEAIQLALTLV